MLICGERIFFTTEKDKIKHRQIELVLSKFFITKINNTMKTLFTLIIMLTFTAINFGQESKLILPAIFSDNMVLQQKSTGSILGKG